MEEGGYTIQDSEGFSSKEIGIKQIALEQYRRCAIEGSKNIINDPIQREVYVNAVKSMEILVFPDIMSHDDIKDRISINENKITNLEKEYNEQVNRLKKQSTDGKTYSSERLQHKYEKRLIELMQEKLIVIGLLLKKMNYYGEFSLDV